MARLAVAALGISARRRDPEEKNWRPPHFASATIALPALNAEIGYRPYVHEIDIQDAPAARLGRRRFHEGRLAHAPFTHHDGVLGIPDHVDKLALKTRPGAEVFPVNNPTELEWSHPLPLLTSLFSTILYIIFMAHTSGQTKISDAT